MRQPHFFPSHAIAFNIGRIFFIRAFVILFLLVAFFQTLDVLGESERLLGEASNSNANLWHYVWLRVPQIIQTFLPFSVLLSTISTLITLSKSNVGFAMKAASLSANQVLAPLFIAALLVAAISFGFNERIAARATAALAAWQKVEYSELPEGRDVLSNIWVREGDDLINAQAVEISGPAIVLRDVKIYQRSGGILSSIVSADTARATGGGDWELTNARRLDRASRTTELLGTVVAMEGVNPDRFVEMIERRPRSQPSNVENIHRHAAFWAIGIFEDGLAGRLLKRLVEIVFPLLGAFTGFIFGRSTLLVRVIVGAAWGFSYLVAGNLAISATIIGTLSLFFAVLIPIVFCELLGNFLRSQADKLHSDTHQQHLPKIDLCGD